MLLENIIGGGGGAGEGAGGRVLVGGGGAEEGCGGSSAVVELAGEGAGSRWRGNRDRDGGGSRSSVLMISKSSHEI